MLICIQSHVVGCEFTCQFATRYASNILVDTMDIPNASQIYFQELKSIFNISAYVVPVVMSATAIVDLVVHTAVGRSY